MGRQNALELASRGADIVINYSSSAPAAEAVLATIISMGRVQSPSRPTSPNPLPSYLFSRKPTHISDISIL
jgi:hypothetical protein